MNRPGCESGSVCLCVCVCFFVVSVTELCLVQLWQSDTWHNYFNLLKGFTDSGQEGADSYWTRMAVEFENALLQKWNRIILNY